MASRLHAHIGSIRQLEILLAVYDGGSIRAAAEQLHLTQPTISVQLKKLADSVGMPIYEQVGRKRIFTEAGLALVETAREILASFENLDMHLSELRGLTAGTLKLAVVTTAKYFIPHLLGPFCQRYPAIDVQFKVGNREQILARLAEHRDDIYVFCNPPRSEDLEVVDFLPNPLVVVAPQSHPYAGRSVIGLEELAKEPYLMRETGSGTRHAIEKFLQKQGVELNVRMTIESNEAIKHAIMAGLGISILSAHSFAFGGSAGLTQLPVREFPIETNWYLVFRKTLNLSPIAKTFLNYVQTEGRQSLLNELQAELPAFA